MKTLLFPLLALAGLSLSGVAQAQIMNVPCDTVLDISNWSSTKSEGHYFSSRVDVRNISTGPIEVTTTYSGRGALLLPPLIMGVQRFTRRQLARTDTAVLLDNLRASTTFSCRSGVTERPRD